MLTNREWLWKSQKKYYTDIKITTQKMMVEECQGIKYMSSIVTTIRMLRSKCFKNSTL